MRHLALAALLAGCTGEPAASPPSQEPAPQAPGELGWVTSMVGEPARFEQLMTDTSRDGWIALHGHDYLAAARAFSNSTHPQAVVGAQRAWLAEHTLHQDLQRLTTHASHALFDGWTARSTPPAAAATVHALALRCGGQPVPPTAVSDWDALSGEGPLSPAILSHAPPAFAERMAHHQAALSGDPEPLRSAATAPMLTTQDGDISRRWFDPCVHHSLARAATDALGDDPATTLRGWTDPAASLFAPWLDPADLTAQLSAAPENLGAASTRIEAALGLPALASSSDDADQERAQIRALDARLNALRADLLDDASADAAALIEQIGVIDRLRTEVLVARARRDLRAGRPNRALAALSLARDVTTRTISPSNSPSLLALLAEANLRTGRAREALDALQALTAERPEATGAREIVSDLAVLQGLDRRGDSKEH